MAPVGYKDPLGVDFSNGLSSQLSFEETSLLTDQLFVNSFSPVAVPGRLESTSIDCFLRLLYRYCNGLNWYIAKVANALWSLEIIIFCLET